MALWCFSGFIWFLYWTFTLLSYWLFSLLNCPVKNYFLSTSWSEGDKLSSLTVFDWRWDSCYCLFWVFMFHAVCQGKTKKKHSWQYSDQIKQNESLLKRKDRVLLLWDWNKAERSDNSQWPLLCNDNKPSPHYLCISMFSSCLRSDNNLKLPRESDWLAQQRTQRHQNLQRHTRHQNHHLIQ